MRRSMASGTLPRPSTHGCAHSRSALLRCGVVWFVWRFLPVGFVGAPSQRGVGRAAAACFLMRAGNGGGDRSSVRISAHGGLGASLRTRRGRTCAYLTYPRWCRQVTG